MYDITDKKSHQDVHNWMAEVEKHAAANISRVLVGNKNDLEETIKRICSIVSGPVSAEVTATELSEMIDEGKYLASLATPLFGWCIALTLYPM